MQKPQRIGELFGIPGMPCSCHICTTASLNCMAGKCIWPILQICVQAVRSEGTVYESGMIICGVWRVPYESGDVMFGIPGMPYESGLRVPYTNLVWLYVVSEGSRTNLAMWCLASLGCRTNQVWGYRTNQVWLRVPCESGLRVPYESGLTEGTVRIRCEGTVRIRCEGTVRISSEGIVRIWHDYT